LLGGVALVVGFAFTAVQDVGDWVTYSDHSLRQLGVYVGKGVGFDFVHAVSCALFALAFGPALARSIGRFASRIQVTWLPAPGGLPTLLVALAVSSGWLAGQPVDGGGGTAAADAAATPASYLLSAQNVDGGFGGSPGAASAELYSGWAALGLAAEGYNAQHIRHGSRSLSEYLAGGAATNADPGSLERTILALRAAGLNAGDELVRLRGDLKPDGSVSGQVNLTSFAILALRAAGQSPPPNAIAWLVRQQDSDGGFNFATRGGFSDVDDTGGALEALAGTGSGAVPRAVRFIDSAENGDGGFPSQPGGPSNAQSTAWAVQGLLASGVGFGSLGRPLGYLRSLVGADGHVRYSKGSDQTPVWVTAEAVMALAGKPLPIAPVPSARGAHHAAPVVHPSATLRAKPPPARRHQRAVTHAPADSLLSRLVADVGVLDALALAPVR
jgi:energy-coupling factor transport system substrate-specific component